MTTDELNTIVAAVVAELEKSGVDFDYKAEQAEDDDLVFVIRGTAPNYQGVTVTWKGLLDIITAQATQAKNDAVTAKNTANTILTQVQSKGTEITNFVATSKAEIDTQKNESVEEVRSVYTSDLNELKGDLSNYLGLTEIAYTLNAYIKTSGSTVDVSSPISYSGYAYAVVNCQGGDVFTVSGAGGATPRVWCFIDSSGNNLAVADSGVTLTNKIIIAPPNAAKLVLNNSSGAAKSYVGRFLVEEVKDNKDTTDVIGNIFALVDNGKMVFDYSLFEHGAYYTSSVSNYPYLVKSKSTIIVNRPITIKAKSGFKVKQLDNPRVHDTGWVDEITLVSGAENYICIRRDPVDYTEIANIAEFVSAVTFDSYDKTAISDIDGRVTELENEGVVPKEVIGSNDSYYANGNLIKCYNPYKEVGELSLSGQLHCHTRDYSTGLYYDGSNTPQTTLAAYRALGYDFMTITDYGNTPNGITKVADEYIPDGLVWLFDSQEVRIEAGADETATHMCTYNCETGITGLQNLPIQEYINEYKKRGIIMSLAHPFYSGTPKTFAELDKVKTRLRFAEVFNGLSAAMDEDHSDPYVIPTGYGTDFAWQRLLDNGNAVWGVAVSDAHTISVNWRMEYGCVYVFANNKNRSDILKALSCGNFIASEYLGVTINQPTFVNGVYSIDTGDDGATTVFMKENSQVVKTVNGRIASYQMQGDEKYVRAVVTKGDSQRKVWTQPIINVFDVDYDSYDEFIRQ